jgi:ABC-type antimicrobial peptide transport system permease subunit
MQEKGVGGLTFYVRTSQEPAALTNSVRAIVTNQDSSLPVFDVRSLEEQINRRVASDRLIATLSEFFGMLAALLAAIGIYGLLAYTVTQRTREIGLRMALGAAPRNVGNLILQGVAQLMTIGLLAGLPLAYGLGRLLDSMLYGVKAFQFFSVLTALVALAMVAFGATYLPVRRATKVDPLVALRYE